MSHFRQKKSRQRIEAEAQQRRSASERIAYDDGVKAAKKGKAWEDCPYRSQWLRKPYFDGYRSVIKVQNAP